MPIVSKKVETKTKTKVAPASKIVPGAITGYEKLVDQLAGLEQVITPAVKDALKKQKKLQEELRAVADSQVEANTKARFNGSTHDFAVSEKTEQRTVVVSEARKQLGDKLFNELAKILLADVDRYLSADQQASCIATGRTGPRKGQLVAK